MLNKNNIKYYFFLKRLKKLIWIIALSLSFFLILFNYNTIINITKEFYQKTSLDKTSCDKVTINGIKYSNYSYIQESVNNYCSSKNMDILDLKNSIMKDYWIKDVYIKKIYPSDLKVDIIEYNPFAIYTEDNVNYNLIDEYGDIINIQKDDIGNFSYLLIISGDERTKEQINDLFNILSTYYGLSNKISKVERIGGRRWNLILENNIVVKMPEEDSNIFNAWSNLDKIINIYGLDLDLEEIDLRIKDRVYLKYKEKTASEIKEIK